MIEPLTRARAVFDQPGQIFGQSLRLTTDIRHRRHLPERALGHRSHREQPAGNRALAIEQRAVPRHIQAEPERIGSHDAFRQQLADQRFLDTVIVGARTGTIDDAGNHDRREFILTPRPVMHLHDIAADRIIAHAPDRDA